MAIWDRGRELRLHFDESLILLGNAMQTLRGANLVSVPGRGTVETGAADDQVIAFCDREQRILITTDGGIGNQGLRKPDQLRFERVSVLILLTAQLDSWGQMLLLARGWEKIADVAEQQEPGWTYRLLKSGQLRPV